MAGAIGQYLMLQLSNIATRKAVNRLVQKTLFHTCRRQLAKEKHSIGMFGCGRIANVHLPNILASRRYELKWIVEPDAARIEIVKTQFKLDDTIKFYPPGQKELLQDSNLDAVIVLSPINTHADYICESLQSGKGVFCEKPAAETVKDLKRCYETAERTGKPFFTAFNRRFDQTFMDIKELLSAGSLGTLQALKTTTRDSPKPSYEFLMTADSSGCNILSDLGIHDIDMLVWLTEARSPESIYVTGHIHDKQLQVCGQPDSLAVVVKYQDGVLVTMDIFRESSYGYDIRLEAFGTEGMAQTANPREASTVVDTGVGGRSKKLFYSFPERFEASFKAELDHFADCLEGKAAPLVTRRESLMAADIIQKGVQSYKEKSVVFF